MKNSTFTKFNWKKVAIICLCLLLGLSFSSFIFFLQNKREVSSIEAVKIVAKNGEIVLDFGGEIDLVQSASVGVAAYENHEEYKHDGYSFFVPKELLSATLYYDSTIVVSKVNDSLFNIVVGINATTEYTVKLVIQPGYGFDDEEAYLFAFFSADYENGVGFGAAESDGEFGVAYTLGYLDPNYTGEIIIDVNCVELTYHVNLYYENVNSDGYNYKTVSGFKPDKAVFVWSVEPDSSPDGKSFEYWVVNNINQLKTKDMYKLANGTSNLSIVFGANQVAISTISDGGAELNLTIAVEAISGVVGFSKIVSVQGHGLLKQDSNNPLFVARWENSYSFTINSSENNSSTYWDGFTDGQLAEINEEKNNLRGVKIRNTKDVSGILQVTDDTSTQFKFYNGQAFRKSDTSVSGYEVYNYGHEIDKWRVSAVWNGNEIFKDEYQIEDDEEFGDIAQTIDNLMIGKLGFPVVTLTPSWVPASMIFNEDGITFGESYTLTVPAASEIEQGKSFFSYTVDKIPVATSAVWNYTKITSDNYSFDNGSYFINNIFKVELANVYKITLSGVSGYTVNLKDSAYSTGSGYSSNEYSYSNLKQLTGYTSSSYPLADAYSEYLEGYKAGYENETINLSHKIFKKLYSGQFIYLPHDTSHVEKLPEFYNDYQKTAFWKSANNKAYSTSTSGYSNELSGEGVTHSTTWNISDGQTLTSYYVNKIHLYHRYPGQASYSYYTVEHFSTHTTLDFSEVGGDLSNDTSTFNCWVFDENVARSSAYSYSVSVGDPWITITNTRGTPSTSDDYVTELYRDAEVISGVYVVTKVKGCQLIQNSSNPLIYTLWNNKYDFVIENQSRYWDGFTDDEIAGINETKNNLRGVKTSYSTASGLTYGKVSSASTTQFKFYNGGAFRKADDISKISDYEVYNYGHDLTGWNVAALVGNSIIYSNTVASVGTTFGTIAADLDIVIAANEINEIPTVTLVPVWTEANITIYANNTSYSVTFGAGYKLGINNVNNQSGKTPIAYCYGGNEANLISINGVWNYTGISSGYYGAGTTYAISLTPFYLDNIYKVQLTNATNNGTANTYQLENGQKFNPSDAKHVDFFTLYTIKNVLSNFEYNDYAEQPLIDIYIALLNGYKSSYNDILANDTGLMNKVYTNATVQNDATLAKGENAQFYMYFANNQAINLEVLPKFQHEFSKLIFWGMGTNAYITTNYDSEKHSPELTNFTQPTNYLVSNGTELQARDVYSFKMYYKSSSSTMNVKSGDFGEYTSFDLREIVPLQIQNGEMFKSWVLDANAVAADNRYTFDNGVLTIVATEEKITFTCSQSTSNSHLYYLTDVKGIGRLVQNESNPIIYAVFDKTYTLTIDNNLKTNYWASLADTDKKAEMYGAKSTGVDGNFSTNITFSEISTYKYFNSRMNGTSSVFYKSADWSAEDAPKAYANGISDWYYVYNYGHYVNGWYLIADVTTSSGTNTYYLAAGNNALVDGEANSWIYINQLNELTLSHFAQIANLKTEEFGSSAELTMIPVWEKTEIEVSIDQYNAQNTGDLKMGDVTFGGNIYSLDTSKVKEFNGQSVFAFYYGENYEYGDTNLISLTGIWNYQNIETKHYSSMGSLGESHSISLKAARLDNIYKLELQNATTNGKVANQYQLSVGTFASANDITTSAYYKYNDNGYDQTFKGPEKFAAYNNQAYIDDYIENLSESAGAYQSQLNGGFSIFNKIYTTAQQITQTVYGNDTATGESAQFYMFFAHNHKTSKLPEFMHGLSKHIYWQDGEYAYLSSSYSEDFKEELHDHTNYSNVFKIHEQDVDGSFLWTYDKNLTRLTARYVYSVDMYFNVSTLGNAVYDKVNSGIIGNTGYFGRYNGVGNLNKIKPNKETVAFDCWVLDTDAINDTLYTYSTDGNSITIISKDETEMWIFNYSGTLANDDEIFYITSILMGYGRLYQDPLNPAIYAKFKNEYGFTVDNSKTYWSGFEETKNNTELYGAKSKTSGTNDEFTTTFVVANTDNHKYKFLTSEMVDKVDEEDKIVGMSFYYGADWISADASKAYSNANDGWYYVYNYGHYINGWEVSFTFDTQSDLNGTIIISNDLMIAIKSSSVNDLDINVLRMFDLSNIAAALDTYMTANRIVEIPNITISPVWKEANILAKVENQNHAITFAAGYDLTSYTAPLGKSVMGFYYGDTEENLVAVGGIWNYKGIDSSIYSPYTKSGRVGAGLYVIELTPIYVDNIYKVTLNNATTNGTANTYELEVGQFASSLATHWNEFKFDTVNFDSDRYSFAYYAGQTFVDTYITYLKTYIANYRTGVNGGFSIFNKVYTDGEITGTNIAKDSTEFYMYFANAHKMGTLPEFRHDLSQLIHWQNKNSSKTYVTSKYNEELYSNELQFENSDEVYTYSLEGGQNVWNLSDGYELGGDNNDEIKVQLRARYVYSTRLYYEYSNTATTDYESFNAGYFGRYTNLDITVKDENGNLVVKDEYTPEKQEDKIFSDWMFDTDKIKTETYNNLYSLTVDTTNKVLTVTIKATNQKIFFAYSEENEHVAGAYFITSVVGYGKFVQDEHNPIIYAKWKNIYDTTLDNTSTYWSGLGKYDEKLYGAKSSGINDEFKTTFKISDHADYAYRYLTTEMTDAEGNKVGMSFYHAADWENADASNAYSNATEGWYYAYNYGHYITGWKLKFTVGGKTYYVTREDSKWKSSTTVGTIDILSLNNHYLSEFSKVVDNVSSKYTDKAVVTIYPIWKEANINVYVHDDFALSSLNTLLYSGYFANNMQHYQLNVDIVKPMSGQSVMAYYYGNGEENLIARSGIWNYTEIQSDIYSSYTTTEIPGQGEYSITLIPIYVDNIYKINLENAKISTTATYQMMNTDFKFNSSTGRYATTADHELTFDNTLYTGENGQSYQFKDYSDCKDDYLLIDGYVKEVLEGLKADYRTGITLGSINYFTIFKKVYYSNGEVETVENENDTLIAASAPSFNIYLANGKETGALPVFKKDYYTLILWENANTNNMGQYAYATKEYEPDLHKEEIKGYLTHTDAEGNFTNLWYYEDGFSKQDNSVTFVAYYYRKNYSVEITTKNFETNTIERRGYVRFEIIDTLYAVDNTIEDTSGDYLLIADGSNMLIFNYQGILRDHWDYYGDPSKTLSEIRLYEGCDVNMYVFDQSQDNRSMATGLFDDMIGFKFNQILLQNENPKNLFDELNEDQYSYSAGKETIRDKEYHNKEVIFIDVFFERILYSVDFMIDNQLAGEFNIITDEGQTGYKTLIELENISVQKAYKIDYYANAGFKLEENSFVINNGIKTRSLAQYNESTGDISQEYLATFNYYKNNTLDGTWLRTYFYADHIDYDVNNIDLGAIKIMTCAIEFNYGVKIYDNTNEEFASQGYVIETLDEYEPLSLNELTGFALTYEISNYLTNADKGFYYYLSKENDEYAVISTRMYFPKNHTTTSDNFYSTYSFLLTNKPTNQAMLSSNHLAYMVASYQEGKIIPVDNRNIYLMIEVRKLLTVDMSVAKLENDSNDTIRTTTLSNADNNNTAITVNASAEHVANLTYATSQILGYYKVGSNAINSDNTIVRAYTYYGLENELTTNYDNTRYNEIGYVLNGYDLNSNKFTLESDATLTIKYLVTSLSVKFVYKLDGEIVSLNDVANYIVEDSQLKPNSYNVYHAGDYVSYALDCINPDYDVSVTINNLLMGSTTFYSRRIELVDENRYLVQNADYSLGEIEILVDLYLQNNEKIKVQYQLIDATKRRENDNFGTFNVFVNEEIKQENVNVAEVIILQGRDVYVELALPAGYIYVGIKHETYASKYIEEDADGKIKIIGDFDPNTDAGNYFILIDKDLITANLDIVGNNPNTTKVHEDSEYFINNTKLVTGLYVGSIITFTANPAEQEEYYNFYYLDKDNQKHHLVDESNQAISYIVITSEMIEEINNTVITFGVSVDNKYKLELTVNGEEFIQELTLEIAESGDTYNPGTYYVNGTEINFVVKTDVEGKFNISLKDNVTSEETNYESISTVISLTRNHNLTLTVSPKEYEVKNDKNYLYTTLSSVINNIPDTELQSNLNSIPQTGYVYNNKSTLHFNFEHAVGKLFTIYVSGNDMEDTLVIEFNNNSIERCYVLADETKAQIELSNYGIEININSNRIELSYIVYNDLNIRFDYKEYKLINCEGVEGELEVSPALTQIQLEFNNFVKNVSELESLSAAYNSSKPQLRALQYIRHFNESYNDTEWILIAGKSDSGFVSYVEQNNTQVAEYFANLTAYTIPSTKEKVDLRHMAATMNSIIYNSSKSAHELAGWGGDLVQLVNQLQDKYSSNVKKAAELFNTTGKGSAFGTLDVCADLDAVNVMAIYSSLQEKSLAEAFRIYYSEFTVQQRKQSFIINAFGQDYPTNATACHDYIFNIIENNTYLNNKLISSLGLCGKYGLDLVKDKAIFTACINEFVKYLNI